MHRPAPRKRLSVLAAVTTVGLFALEGSARAEDPLDSEGAPRYVISVDSVKIDRTANWPSWFNVIEHQSSDVWGIGYTFQNWYSGQSIPASPPAPLVPHSDYWGYPEYWEYELFHGTGDIDFFAMSTGVYESPGGLPKAGGAGFSCVFGQGDYGRYETYCQRDPVNNVYVWQPMKLPTPLSVASTETLKINYRLSVLNPTDQVGSASSDNAATTLGNAATYAGTVMAVIPPLTAAAPWVSAAGATLSILGSLFGSDSRSTGAWGCTTHGSLIPTSDGQPTDFAQIALSGADLYANTANGDGLFTFVHDYNAAELCGKPKTTITFRVHRVATSYNSRSAQGGTTVNDYPRVSAFGFDASGFATHDEREVDGTFGRRTRIPGNLCTTCIGVVSNFAADARVVGVSRYPGHLDAFAIDKTGALNATWRDVNVYGGAWQPWGRISRAGQFPAGAPLAVVSVQREAIDVFAIDPSGAILDVYWRPVGNWQGPVVAAPGGTASPYRKSTTWGSVSIASLGELAATTPYGTAIDVVTLGTSGGIAHAGTNCDGCGWTSSRSISPSGVSFVPGGPIAMLSRKWNGLDIVATDSSLVLRTLVFDGAWATTMPPITDSRNLVWFEAPISIAARKQNDTGDPTPGADFDHMDVVTVGLDGKLLHATWEATLNGNAWNPDWVEKLSATADAFSNGGTPPSRLGVVSPFASSIVVSTANPSDATVTWAWFDHALAPGWQGVPRR